MALSCTMWLAHTIATVHSTIASSHMGSRCTLKAVAGDGSLLRQAITSLKPGGGATPCTAPRGQDGDTESCLPAQLAGALLPFGVELSFPQNSSC